jgi:acyl dehydratase
VAEQAGLGGVIAHGMLVMGLVGRAITGWVGVAPLRQFGVRFVGVTRPGQSITVTGRVVEKLEVGDERQIRCEVTAVDEDGEVKVKGSFTAAR